MGYFRLLSQLLPKTIETIRGERSLTEITEARTQIESLVAYSVEGYTVTIHCQERKYRCDYKRWFVPSFVIKTYEVFATIAGKAPDVLIDACARDRTFPRLLNSWANSSSQKEAAIEAFLDLLHARLRYAQSTSC